MSGRGTIGKYEVVKVLGRGSMGVVYLATDPQIGRPVAVKTIALPAGLDEEKKEEYRKRFLQEARAAGRLSHPSIVTVYEADSGARGGPPFIAMEFIPGEPWNHRTRRGPAPDVDRVAELVKQIASALDYAHRSGVVHRDIKPANIVETPDGRAKLMDFGIAKVPTSELTREGQFLGTPAYMSPEQVLGKPVDGRSDLFSLGSVLYEVLCGKKPFPGENIPEVTHKILHHDPPASEANPEVGEELVAILCHLLAKDPGDRYASAAEVVEDLEAYGAGGRPPHSGHLLADDRESTRTGAPPPPGPPAGEASARVVPRPTAPPPPAPPVPPPATPPVAPPTSSVRDSSAPAAPHPTSARSAPGRARPKTPVILGGLLLIACAFASAFLLRQPRLAEPPRPSLPPQVAPDIPGQLLAESPKPPPPKPEPKPVVPTPTPAPDAPPPPPPEVVKAPVPCAVDFSFSTGIVSGEFWIRIDGEAVTHRVVDRDFSMKDETYTGTFQVASGTRTLQVQVKTNRQNVNSVGEEKVDFPEGGQKSLRIVMTKFNKKIKLEWK